VSLQYVEYRELAHLSITLDRARDEFSGFGMRFYTPTAFHGAHVVVGVLWCLLVMRRATRGRYSSRNYVGVEIFGLYWHFVDVVWILLFTLIYLV
jgi:heme/copper-type cytochrome/quinol oxidase subunit 3